MLAVLAALVFGGMIRAEERGKGGAVRGTFVRLVEREVGERGYMGIVIKPFDSDDHVTVLVPQQREGLVRAVRRLQEGQRIRVSFVSEGGHMWLRGMGAERREEVEERRDAERTVDIRREVLRWREGGRDSPEAERPMVHLEQMEGQLKEVVSGHLERMGRALREVLGAHLERMEGECRELRAHVERMERELDELRAENERLRRQLREASGLRTEREREVRQRRQAREREERELRRERRVQRERDARR